MEMEVEGTEELGRLIRQLEALPGVLDRLAVEDGLLEAAKVVAKDAKRRAPAGPTGNLKKSIRARRGTRKYKPSAIVETKRPEGSHAHLVELGTVKTASKPFLEPAVNNTRPAQLRAFAGGVRKNFSKVERELKGKIKVSRKTARALAE